MECTFHHLSGSKQGQAETVNADSISIGRNPASTIAFDPYADAEVSTDHAQFRIGEDGLLQLTDLGSRNGTFLNGQKIGGSPVPCEPGSKVQFGKDGPEVKVDYHPGPKKGATRMMLAQVQQDLEEEKTKAAKRRKRNIIIAAVVGVFVLIGGIIVGVTSSTAKKRQAAELVVRSMDSERDRARGRHAEVYAREPWEAGLAKEELAKAALEQRDYAAATELAEEAIAYFEKAEAQAYDRGVRHALDTATQRALRQAEERMREQARANEERLAQLEAEYREASAEERQRLEAELEELRARRTDSERIVEVTDLARTKILLVEAQVFVVASDGSLVELEDVESKFGTGFLLGDEGAVVTSKEVALPHLFDPELRGYAELLKQQDREVAVRYVVWGWVPARETYRPISTIRDVRIDLVGAGEDAFLEEKVATRVVFGQSPTDVDVTLHDPTRGNFAVLKFQIDTPAGLKTGPAARAQQRVMCVGTVYEEAGPADAGVSGTVTRVGDVVRVTTEFEAPQSLVGSPVMNLDGEALGVVVTVDERSLEFKPIAALEPLLEKARQ